MQLHPENPRYLLFRGRPAVLITSGEHYGAVVNLDFDIPRYLDELHRYGLNLTRVFSGAMIEGPQSIVGVREENTLAPRPGRLAVPWARSATPGYAGGGNKFDLTRWDAAYFDRLRSFIERASRVCERRRPPPSSRGEEVALHSSNPFLAPKALLREQRFAPTGRRFALLEDWVGWVAAGKASRCVKWPTNPSERHMLPRGPRAEL